MKTVIMKIEGMRCPMCESHIVECIRKGLPEAKKVKASRYKNEARFVIEDELDYSKAKEAIEQSGYVVSSTSEEPYVKKCLFCFFKKKEK